MGTDLPFGALTKLTNLLAKASYASPALPAEVAERILWLLHVPLDSYSLLAIRNCIAGSPAESVVGRVPVTASMKFGASIERYNAIQCLMRELTEHAHVPAIALDVLTWNNAHRG